MDAVNHVSYFLPSDLAFAWNYEMARRILSYDFENSDAGVVGAIELYQCSLLMETEVRLVDEDDDSYQLAYKAAKRAKGMSYRIIKGALARDEFGCVLDEAEMFADYGSRVWELIGACKAYEKIEGRAFTEAIKGNPVRIRRACSVGWPSKEFSQELRDSLRANPGIAAEILVEKHSSAPVRAQLPFLPSAFEKEDANEVLREYLVLDDVNLNYVNAIVSWPSNCYINLDDETIVLAKRVQRRLNEELFSIGASMRFGVEVVFDREQEECISVSLEGTTVRYSYGMGWLKQTLDNASILTNLAVVFCILGNDRVLAFSSNGRFESALMNLLMRPRASFVMSESSRLEGMRLQGCLGAYRAFLKSEGISLESVIEWYFNTYLYEVFGVGGLVVNMPSGRTTYLEKCKLIGPEIEKVLKAFSVFSKRGCIDPDYYEVETFAGFENVPSLLPNKYVCGVGEKYVLETNGLFSDQSVLNIAVERNEGRSFADKIALCNIKEENVSEFAKDALGFLLDNHCVLIDDDGMLWLTGKAAALKRMWQYGSYPVAADTRFEDVYMQLVSDQEAEFYSALFSKEESDYLNYVFNGRGFSDSLGLRNKWAHGGGLDTDANSMETVSDYLMLLMVMICVLLKINEELVMHCDVDLEIEAVDCEYMKCEGIGDPNTGSVGIL